MKQPGMLSISTRRPWLLHCAWLDPLAWRPLHLAVLFPCLALFLSGCAVILTTTTSTTITTTTTSTTTTTKTTETGPGGCRGRDPVDIWEKPQWCFCFYTGGCLQHFQCYEGEPLPECQRRLCGERPLDEAENSVSFFNINDQGDILTVPNLFYTDISDMKGRCEDGGLASLRGFLEDGRRVFEATRHCAPEWQCLHLHGNVGVEWLHVHSFTGSVAHEELPSSPPWAVCARAGLPPEAAAQAMLAVASMLDAKQPASPASAGLRPLALAPSATLGRVDLDV